MIDPDGYRPNVGLIIFNDEGKLLWAKRIGQDAWQFPQGGIMRHERPENAALRELREEVGLAAADVEVVASTSRWLRYRLPEHLIRQRSFPVCIGQKQRWFLLRLLGATSSIRFDLGTKPEFDDIRWIDYWEAADLVVSFKRNVYRRALEELRHPYTQTLGRLREVSEEVPRERPGDVPEELPEELPQEVPEEVPPELPEELPGELPEEVPGELPEELPGKMPAEFPERLPGAGQ